MVPEISNINVCPAREDRTTISLFNKDFVLLYEYKDEDVNKCVFKEVQQITMNGLINTVCFSSGYMHYLATSGATSHLFKYESNTFMNDKTIEHVFRGNANKY